MNNILLNSPHLHIPTLESDSDPVLLRRGRSLTPTQDQNQNSDGASNSLIGDGPQRGIHFGTPAQLSSQQQPAALDPASSDSPDNTRHSDPTSQLVEELMKTLMQWLQSLLGNNEDSGDGQKSGVPGVSARQDGSSTQGVPPTQSAGDSQVPADGTQVTDPAASAAVPGTSGGAAEAAAVPATSPASGASDNSVQQTAPTPDSGVSDTSAADGSNGLHLPPALEPYRSDIQDAAKATGVPANVIAGLVYAESRGKNDAATTNVTGNADLGPAQVDTQTFNALKQQNPALLGNGDIKNAHDNIMAGALYLRDQRNAFGGDMGAALRAYNSGPGNVNRSNLADTGGAGDPSYVNHVMNFAQIIGSGSGHLPA